MKLHMCCDTLKDFIERGYDIESSNLGFLLKIPGDEDCYLEDEYIQVNFCPFCGEQLCEVDDDG